MSDLPTREDYERTITELIGKLARAEKERDAAREALREARLQIEYLHDKFKPTGSGNRVLAQIDAALSDHQTGPNDKLREVYAKGKAILEDQP